jgi:hypothetical protein
MVAGDLSVFNRLPKLPSVKDEWLLSYKKTIENFANTLQILPHLRGLAEAPIPPAANAHRDLHRDFDRKKEKFDKEAAFAWQFLFEISNGTPLQTLLSPFEEIRDSHGAWSSIVEHYETGLVASKRQVYEQKLNLIRSSNTITDLSLLFKNLVTQIEQYCNALGNLPMPQQLIVDNTTKKLKLVDAMVNRSQGKFDAILQDTSTNVEDYVAFQQAVEKKIDQQAMLDAIKIPTVASIKASNEKNETASIPALQTSVQEDQERDPDINELKALKADINKNARRVSRAMRRLESTTTDSNDRSRPQDTSNNSNSDRRSTTRSGRHYSSYNRPNNWRGGRRHDVHRGNRQSFRDRNTRNTTSNDNYSTNNRYRPYYSNNSNPNDRNYTSYYRGSYNSYRGGRGGRYGRYSGGRGGNQGRWNHIGCIFILTINKKHTK